MQEKEAATDGHATETVGWIAIELGTTTTADGHNVDVASASGDYLPTTTAYTQAVNRLFPTALIDLASANDEDGCGVRNVAADHLDVTFVVEEERSLDDETDHGTEAICIFLAE
jgi:hypothetical protein